MRASTTITSGLILSFLCLVTGVGAGEPAPAPRAAQPPRPTVFLIGDSTVRNGTRGQMGWGTAIGAWFDQSRISVTNRALGGRSSRTFLTEGLWEKVRADLKLGDFVLMQFGHNDNGPLDDAKARASIKGAGDESRVITNKTTGKIETVYTYGWYLRKYIAEAKAKGATPIVLSLVPRNIWKEGKVIRAANDFAKWAAEAARAEGVPFVNLNEIVARQYDALGQERVAALFGGDHTHTNPEGARLNAACVVEGLRGLTNCSLKDFLLKEPVPSGPAPASDPAPAAAVATPGKIASKPLFRDPVHDGAADPVVVWNRQEKKWFMLYTNRRANLTNAVGVSWVHGTHIGVAESSDGGANWKYRGVADIPYGQGEFSYWAPEVVWHQGLYHMFLSYVPGMHTDWSGTRDIVHLTSTNLLQWKPESVLKLASSRVIDACVLQLPDGTWRMWYNNEPDRKAIYYADSPDLYQWEDRGKAIGDRAGEGPKVFHWKGRYWMVVDNWQGLGIYSSDDLLTWKRQSENLLEQPGEGADDRVKGGHPDVVVGGDRAFVFYFTHPGRRGDAARKDGYEQRRSSIQVAELECKDGVITCDRNKPVRIALQPPVESASLSLDGLWRFALDRSDTGVQENWFERSLADRIRLPGILQAQGYGDEISTNTPWVLSLYDRLWFAREDYRAYTRPGEAKVPFVCQPPRHYLGAAWYQRDLDLPGAWANRRVALYLERPHWETRVWVDDREVGNCNSLVAPHEYELGQLSPGRHRLTVRVDNRLILPYRPDAHSVSDSLGGSWNGIAGRIELRATSPVWIDCAQVFPDVSTKSVLIKVRVSNRTGKPGAGTVSAGEASAPVAWTADGGAVELKVPLGNDALLWDEFHPNLQRLTVRLAGEQAEDAREVTFGLREFEALGQDFIINGRKTHLRGTHHGGDFPLTGHPPTDVSYWRKLFQVCREWGLNHVRFHSFCPPEAAFTAADEIGVYLQPEPGMWNEISPGTPMEKMLYAETERMIRAYGNHPSFVLCSASNEPKGAWKRSLPAWVEHFRAQDPRHLYTTGTGWSLIDEPGPVKGADYLAVHRIGGNMLRGNSAWFGRDYSRSLQGVNVPVVSHELGQWCAYPDYDLVAKFTGYLRPGNYEIFRDSLKSGGMLDRNKDFAWASGRFQLQCYKEEIEANLRTPGLAGFQLLDLHDYVGQGTALVGLLDPFWETKGYVAAKEFRGFCGPTVPLARLPKRVFTTEDVLESEVEVANYGAAPLANAPAGWRVEDAAGKTVLEGKWTSQTIPIGKGFSLGKVQANLSSLTAPGAYRLSVFVGAGSTHEPSAGGKFENSWNFWVYPAKANPLVPSDVLVTRSWAEAEARLNTGGKVLFLPRPADLGWSSPPLDNLPVFWNRLMNPAWGRMLGLWCDANHPALSGFPTAAAGDWQWMELVRRKRAVNLDGLPRDLQPIVQPVDDWNRNYKLGLIFEAEVGAGRLLVCALDLEGALGELPAARQLRRSLLDYMAGNAFRPRVRLTPERARGLWFDSFVMRKLGAQAAADAGDGRAALDGDPNTFWSAGSSGRGADGTKHPHQLTISFPTPVAMRGLMVLNRQNDRDHLGDVRAYTVQVSDDGGQWRQVAAGELASTWRPQTIDFPAQVIARQLKFTATSGFGRDTSAALAELAILYAGPKLPENKDGEIEYQRVRSTSTDVDEGSAGSPSAPSQQKKRQR